MSERWITFDCYGTLVDWQSGFTAILRPIAGDRTGDVLDAYYRHEPRVEAERPFRCYREVLTITLSRAMSEVGVRLAEEQTHCLPEQWPRLQVFSDVEAALASLRALGYKPAVLTNCDNDLFAQTQRSFALPFDRVVTAEQVRDYKPALSHFRCFEETSRVHRNDWVHVACSWSHDIEPARALGIKHIWLDRAGLGEQTSSGTIAVLSATELPGAVKHLFETPAR